MNEYGDLLGNFFTILIAFLVGFLIVFLIFSLFREFWCWYWKINKRVAFQRDTNELLKKLLSSSSNETREESALAVKNQIGDSQDKVDDFKNYEL